MVDVKFDIEAQSYFPKNTCVICVIVHDTVIELYALSEIVY